MFCLSSLTVRGRKGKTVKELVAHLEENILLNLQIQPLMLPHAAWITRNEHSCHNCVCTRALLFNRLEKGGKKRKKKEPPPHKKKEKKRRKWRLSTVGITTVTVVVASIHPWAGSEASTPRASRHNREKAGKKTNSRGESHACGVVFPRRHTQWPHTSV